MVYVRHLQGAKYTYVFNIHITLGIEFRHIHGHTPELYICFVG